MGVEHAILLQNAFPTLEKYIDHIHTKDGIPVKVVDNLKDEILFNFINLLKLKSKGINLFFTEIDKTSTFSYQLMLFFIQNPPNIWQRF